MITPQTEYRELAQALGLGENVRLYLKREDLHPYGSHKGRSIPVMIDMKMAEGVTDFALSSSGNAALAAIRHIQKKNAHGANLSLTVFIGANINPEKKAALMDELTDPNDTRIAIKESPRPLQALFNVIKGIGDGKKTASLRQSTDPDALVGYQALAHEIASVDGLSAVFIPASSGTTAQAIAESFANNSMRTAVHIVQTANVSPLAEAFSKTEKAEQTESSLADAIVDKTGYRKDALVKSVRQTGGTGWIVTNSDIATAQKIIKDTIGVELTGNGALSIAGLMKAQATGMRFKGAVMCVITGR